MVFQGDEAIVLTINKHSVCFCFVLFSIILLRSMLILSFILSELELVDKLTFHKIKTNFQRHVNEYIREL